MIKPTGDRIGNCKASHGELGEHPRGERLSIGVPRSGCSPIPDVCGVFNVSTYEAVLKSSHATVNKVIHFLLTSPRGIALNARLLEISRFIRRTPGSTSLSCWLRLLYSFALWYFGRLPQPRELDICCRRKSRLFFDTFWKILADGPLRLSRLCGMRKERDSDD
jgi:hypothetical protein